MSHWLTLLQVWSGGATVGTGASCVHGALPQRLYGLSPQIRRQVRDVAASPVLDIYALWKINESSQEIFPFLISFFALRGLLNLSIFAILHSPRAMKGFNNNKCNR
jgi:hypothetical protein